MPDHAPAEPRATLLYDIAVLERATSELIGEAMRSAPLRPMEYAVTSAVLTRRTAGTSDLAREFSVPLTTATDWVTRLVERGLMSRVPDPRDGRRHRLVLTEVGRATHQEAAQHFGRAHLAFQAHVGPDTAALQAGLVALTDAARAARADLGG